jgi:hypothetical protein
MDMDSGFLSMESFVNARSSTQRQHKMDSLQGIFSQLALSYLQSDFVLSVLITEKKRHIFPLCLFCSVMMIFS